MEITTHRQSSLSKLKKQNKVETLTRKMSKFYIGELMTQTATRVHQQQAVLSVSVNKSGLIEEV